MKRASCFLLCWLGWATAWAQQPLDSLGDLYGPENTLRFAQHLDALGDYDRAQSEWERLVYWYPQNNSFFDRLLLSYYRAGSFEAGRRRFRQRYYGFPPQSPPAATTVYYRLELALGNFGLAQQLLNDYPFFDPSFKKPQELGLLLLSGQADSAAYLADRYAIHDPALLSLINRGKTLPQKDPWLSGILSALVPGLGKVYAGQWKDGLIGFVFVGANAFGAARAFNQEGADSFFGWFFTGVGTAFYVGNIYGSAKVAKEYNRNQNQRYARDVQTYLLP